MARCPRGGKAAMGEPNNPHPADFPIGSLASRAAARARLESFMPIIKVIHFEIDPNGTPPPGLASCPRECDSVEALIEGGGLASRVGVGREPGESLQEFQDRVTRMAQSRRHPNFAVGIIFLPKPKGVPETS